MSNLLDSTPDSITQKALVYNFSQDEKSRRDEAILNKDFFYGNQEQALSLLNDDVDAVVLNLTSTIAKKRAQLLYKRPVNRKFEGSAKSRKFIEKLYKENRIASFMLAVDLASELTGSGLVHVTPDDTKETGLKLSLYDASSISPIEGEDGLEALSLIKVEDRLKKYGPGGQPTLERVIKQQVWTRDSVTTYEGQKVVSSEINELEFLPFTNFRGEEVYDQYLGHSPTTSIRKLNAQINQMLTNLGYMIKMQSGTPIALTGFEGGEGISIHPGKAFSLPVGASASVLNLSPKIKDTLDAIQYLEEKLFETSSVPKVSIVGGEGASGVELSVRWYPLLQVFEEKANRFQAYELDLANMILDIVGLDRLDSLYIDWDMESILPVSPDTENLERDIKLNLKTPIDELMRRDPNLNDMTAQAHILANKQINEGLNNEVINVKMLDKSDEEPQEDTSEDNETNKEEEGQ